MKGMPFTLQSQGFLEDQEASFFWSSKKSKSIKGGAEPTSVLENRSPSPSTSTLSSSLGGGASSGSAAAAPPELPPIPSLLEKCGLDDFESMLSDPTAPQPPQDPSLLRWILGDSASAAAEDSGTGFPMPDPGFGFFGFDSMETPAAAPPPPPPPLNGGFYQDPIEEKTQPFLFTPNFLFNQPPQNPSFFLPIPQFDQPQLLQSPHLLPPLPKPTSPDPFPRRIHPPNPPGATFLKPGIGGGGGDGQALLEQLFKAAELVEAGNSPSARGILARLNHLLPSPLGKPLLRAAFYFKEALNLLLNNANSPNSSPLSTPLDVLLKLGSYKAFSEISPIIQFTNFTSIQSILEELSAFDHIHIVDFDVGFGGHWPSFIQELAHRRSNATPSLKITAFASHSSHHPLELHLTRENLSHFAADLNVAFEFNILGLDSFDPSAVLALSLPGEAIAVNLPIGSCINQQLMPTILRLVKQLNPKIVVSVDHGCNRSDLQFSHHFFQAFQSCTVFLDSIDASGASPEVANKIERYLVQPRIENAVLCRHGTVEKMAPWRNLFTSAGFVPLQLSNFTETQAECLLKRVQVRGFQVEKRQASLFLCWQRGELVSVSSWKC